MTALAAFLDRILTEHHDLQDAVAAERHDPTPEPIVGGWLTRPQIVHASYYPAVGEPLAAQLYRRARDEAAQLPGAMGMMAAAAVKELRQAHREYIDQSVGDRPDLLVEDRWCNAYAEVLSYVRGTTSEVQAVAEPDPPAEVQAHLKAAGPREEKALPAMMATSDIAIMFGVPLEPLRKRLDRWRKTTLTGWREVERNGPREPQYLFEVEAIRPIAEGLKTSDERPAKNNSRKTHRRN